ncbi:hypothetical protein ACFL1L_02480 [Thermoplasmatota archaeon]
MGYRIDTMVRKKIGKRKIVYLEDGRNQTRALRGDVAIEDDFFIITTDRFRPPIMINKSFVISIKNIG